MKNYNKIGLGLCAIYLALSGLSLWAAYSAGADFKGQFVMLQLPIALQLSLFDVLGLRWVNNLSWLATYCIFVPLTLLVLYGVGVFLTYLWRRAKWLFFILLLLPIIFLYDKL